MTATLSPLARNRSLWLADAPRTDYRPLGERHTCDVAIVGGGITGLTTALLLQRAGMNVVVVEAGRIGCGVTGHTTAKLTSLHGLIFAEVERNFGKEGARTYAEANQAGIELVRKLVGELTIDCQLQTQPAVTYTAEEGYVEQVRREAEAAARAGLAAHFTTEVDLPFPVRGAVRVEDQAQFHPYSYCEALARAIVAGGGTIFEQSRATNFEQGASCTVSTEGGEVGAQYVVLATLLPPIDQGGYFAFTYPSRSYGIGVSLTDASAPEGMHISVEQPTRSVRPLADRRGIVVVGETHKVGHDTDTRARYEALEAWTKQWFPVSSIDYRWSSQDWMSVDRVPFIGRLASGWENVFVATGFNKWGLTTGSFAARMIADMIAGRENPWAGLFESRRTSFTASASKLVTENTDVATRYFGDRLRSLAAPKVDELALGEGAIADRDGQKLAAYRDETGAVHAVSPICTHLGCYVQWNTAEKSWDCPCHGSRFDIEGRVLQGPAVSPLERPE